MTPPSVLFVSSDVFLLPRLEDAAASLGFRLDMIDAVPASEADDLPPATVRLTEPLEGSDAALVRRIAHDPPALIVFDLASPDLPWPRWIQTLKTSSATRRVPIIAFGPHKEAEALERAAAMGADRVVTRGQFQSRLAEILQAEARPTDEAAVEAGCREPLSPEAVDGIAALGRGEYFEAHEHLERAVLADPGPAGTVYRCLLHLAVAHLHTERGNWRGAEKMLLRMRPWLSILAEECRGVETESVRVQLNRLQAELDRWRETGTPPGQLPPPVITARKE